MKINRIPSVVAIAVSIVVLGGTAVVAQDKYALQIPNGLAFSEFRGYETWQVVSLEDTLNVIVANPLMIEAYRAGVPGNGQPWPDGAKTASR